MRRLVLFDIDGTLLRGGKLWRESFEGAVRESCPSARFGHISYCGKTDPQICRETLLSGGVTEDQVPEVVPRVLKAYLDRVVEGIRTRSREIEIFPGVHELLGELKRRDDVYVGLLTGNIRRGARLKLSGAKLDAYFDDIENGIVGAFGDDHWNRYELPPIAVRRAKEILGRDFSGKQVVIIGDTVHDVNCGKSIGVRSIAVGTGHDIPEADLLGANPDFYFKDFSLTDEVVRAVLDEI